MKKDSTMKRVLKLLKPYTGFIILSLIFALGTVISTLMIPVLEGRAVDHIIGKGKVDFSGLLFVLKEIAAVAAVTFFCQLFMNLINNHITYSVAKTLRQRAFERLLRVPVKVIDSESHGDIASRIVTDADSFTDGLLLGFTQLFTGIMTIAGTIIFMIRIRFTIALIVIAATPVSLLIAKFISGRTYRYFTQQSKDRGDLTEYIDERISLEDLVSQLGAGELSKEEFVKKNNKLTDSATKATFYSSLTNPSTRFVNAVIYAVVGVVGAFLAVAGSISVGELTSFLGYAREYARPFNEITGVITEMQNAMACAARIFEIIDQDQVEDCDGEFDGEVKGAVDMEHVDFSYVPEKPLITDLNVKVNPGEKVAIVGPTGAGKTTLINLLMRFYDVNAGSVKVDGRDIRTVSRNALRSRFGMVLQETFLFSGTIRDNLTLGKPDATDEEIIEASKAAHAHEFIRKLPDGYDTVLSPSGTLSQGQKQLLCIARLMLALPPMLILDEATSSIDTRTEMKIQDAFNKMMKGRTTFVVAHRLQTIRDADMILYMENGHVLEQGNHKELLAKNGYYAKLYRSQFMS
ncbi:MAG: ABC transporter ATP-binding protein [Lachnospiraceae bacterium]|uniref:ABC transporter ATP-binding protein n=1 Tax=Candidatus Weimeria bifida TaxID=2599074 RepID=A0A6N7J0W6_9FIRM|nr:ABC transporter ATP-binding protein [Candidatus Weimeria bifida]RRF97378.1 MAG: ABC transporter ATP-binding protein [Lachnospiraceae bacterium]